jgi:protein arginine kinase activator
MLCQNCLKNPATVHVTDLGSSAAKDGEPVQERHLCEICAQALDLPHVSAPKKTVADIWKLLQLSAQATRKKGGPACPHCGLTLEEFRRKGRLGCAKDYEVFGPHIAELLERVHGARVHVGRLPANLAEVQPKLAEVAEALKEAANQTERESRLVELRAKLAAAIREEAYERAAKLRDELRSLESAPPTGA